MEKADKMVGMITTGNSATTSQKGLARLSQKEIEIASRYGSLASFIEIFHPQKIAEYTKDEMRCFTGNAPSLYWLCKTYTDTGCKIWVEAMLKAIIEKLPSADNAPEMKQLDSIANWLIRSCGWMKVSELMLFVRDFGTYCDTPVYSVNEFTIKAQIKGFAKRRAIKLDEAEKTRRTSENDEYIKKIRSGKTMDAKQWEEYKLAHPNWMEEFGLQIANHAP